MVSPLQSIRSLTSQSLLKSLKETDQQSQTQSDNARSSLLQRYGVNTSSSRSEKSLSALLHAQYARTSPSTATDKSSETKISTDITTSSFMGGLKQKLEEMATAAGTSKQAKSMLAALEAGTLTVTDPLKGVTLTAWDIKNAQEKNTPSKPGKHIEPSGWSQFLKANLTLGNTGGYARSSDGSYVDQADNTSSYFGTVGSQYVYLSWPQSSSSG